MCRRFQDSLHRYIDIYSVIEIIHNLLFNTCYIKVEVDIDYQILLHEIVKLITGDIAIFYGIATRKSCSLIVFDPKCIQYIKYGE